MVGIGFSIILIEFIDARATFRIFSPLIDQDFFCAVVLILIYLHLER